ncbi:zinc finger protein [Penicillium brevicompactum]|uniref:uncharacterized protein n=1 Tax=Penicillium brevicompactum TaxID=5074 RepID=UPI0025405A41|nr:uncharacterized protein N7506_005548 [Penicillium brevicompactum]KAJ5337526.1 hypothetical protein N7506_005548 [Penicillium brevicompactum]
MPPIRGQKAQKSIEQEGRILLAIKALKNGRFISVAAAARSFEVPRSTLQDRMKGITSWSDTRAIGHKFTQLEEESIQDWLISMDHRGAALTIAMLRDMANLLLKNRGEHTLQTVSKNWPTQYIKRHPGLSSRFSRRYDYKRALMEDPKTIIDWYKLVEKTIAQYGITSDDIFNFDESGFAMEVSATTKIITQSFYTGRRGVLQAGNREWVTVIETICASGRALPPYVIFKGKNFMVRWFDDLPKHWALNVSPNGWTSNEIGVDWLQKHFIPHVKSQTKGKDCLLVLDGHDSHLTATFDKICQENNIIPICMPPHASHLLQPLDVGCFAVLKRSYGRRVAEYTRLGIDSIEKDDFLDIFPAARNDSFKESIVQSAFAATGLVPLDPDRVLSKLNIRLQYPPLLDRPVSQGSTSGSNISTGVPQTTRQLEIRKSRLDSGLSSATDKISSPTKRDLQQFYNMSVKLVHEHILMRDEIKRLREGNRKQTKKREKSKKQIPNKGSLTELPGPTTNVGGEEGASVRYIFDPAPALEPYVEPTLPVLPPVRRKITCSGCNQKGHSFNKCPKA